MPTPARATRVPRAPVRVHASSPTTRRGRGRGARGARATGTNGNDESIEALEARLKTKRNQPTGVSSSSSSSDATTNPAFGYLDTAAKRDRVRPGANGQLAMWERDPAAWEETPAAERAWTVWTGEKGWMYWMNQASLYGAGGIAFGWVLFRFIGPAIGLYTLN
jgi:hypothetical protein